jgi:hypothetical protein
MKLVKQPFTWKVYIFDINSNKLVEHDVLKYRENFVKELKKKCTTKEEFIDKLFRDFMWQYWSRAEYEMLIYIENDRVFVEPWVSCKNLEEARVDVTERPGFDWSKFAKLMIYNKGYRDGIAKIDVYDQLGFRFNELADFCWEYKHKYQRRKKD